MVLKAEIGKSGQVLTMRNIEGSINWKSDLLLHGLTANQLISFERSSEILFEKNRLNLYSILIKCEDFNPANEGKDSRILSRMPYLRLSDELWEIITKKSWLIAQTARDYFFGSSLSDYSISSWNNRLKRYLKRLAVPLPIVRSSPYSYKQFLLELRSEEKITIESARGEVSEIPTALTDKLAYICGVSNGDGHLNLHNMVLCDYSQKHIEMLQKICSDLFGLEGQISGEDKLWLLFLNNKWVVRLINFLTDQPIGGKKYAAIKEPLLFKENLQLRSAYWRGAMDADGSYRGGIYFSSASEAYILDFVNFLSKNGILPTGGKNINSDGYYAYIPSRFRKAFSDLLGGSWHPEKKKELAHLLSKRPLKSISYRPTLMVSSNEPFTLEKTVYGINNDCLTANGFFDFFRFAPDLRLRNCGHHLKKTRALKGYSRAQMDTLCAIEGVSFSAYENESVTIPISILRRVLASKGLTPDQMTEQFLLQNGLQYFQLQKSVIYLPLKPTQELLKILSGVKTLANLFFFPEDEAGELIGRLCDFFRILEARADHCLYNSALKLFLETFMILQ